jgi:hypothetical protein
MKGGDSQGSMVGEDMLGELVGESCIYYYVMKNG